MKTKAVQACLAISLCWTLQALAGGESDWVETTRAQAAAAAQGVDKLILLVAGRDTCPNTQYLKTNMYLRLSIEQVFNPNYVLWYCNMDHSTEWLDYSGGLGAFVSPLVCVIDPHDALHYLDRTTGPVTNEPAFRARLVSHIPGADAYEPDNTPATAKTLGNRQTQNRSLHMAGDADWAKFKVGRSSATGVVVATAGPAGGDTELRLYSGSTLVAFDDNSGPGEYSRIALASLVPGTYRVKVNEFQEDDKIPAYTLRAQWWTPPPAADAYEPDNRRSAAKRIRNGRTQNRTIHRAGNRDFAKFTIGARGAFSVRIRTAGASGDTEMWLYDAAGHRLAYDDNSGPGRFSQITPRSLPPGTYTIRVQEKGNNGTIPAYTLRATWTAL